ncbi:MAG TPA: NB-ARC domain-containing protein, partial [Pyrinomonadaceae bacterium]|nr:NB-ARC domain-containing protein [Pyrinomonadaceae bacterium]
MTKDSRTAFISYTRQSGAIAAERLRELLTNNGIKPWQDRTHLRGGDDFWQQIELAIRRCSYIVMVLTPDAFGEERQILRREWYAARSAGTCVVPIKGTPGLNLADDAIPRWIKSKHVVDLDQPAEVKNLIQQLQSECRIERVPFMVEDLPENYTPRPDHLNSLRDLLLGANESRVALTTALRGSGGFGKTTLAQAICHDDRIITEFEHGILWVTLGEHPRMVDKLAMLFTALTDEQQQFADIDAARIELADRLRWKRCLIVIDDVWNYNDLQPLLQGGPESVRLITTRQASIAAEANAVDVSVNEMTTAEAVDMLAANFSGMNLSRSSLTHAAQRLGEWPLLLKLFAGYVTQSFRAHKQSAEAAVNELLAEFGEIGATAFDRPNAEDRGQAIAITLGLSLKRLSPLESARCAELSIFPEDIAIPLHVVGELWHASEVDTRRTLRHLADLGLINLDLGSRSISIHDVIRDYLHEHLERPQREVHSTLVDAWPEPTKLPHEYAWRWFTHHLAKAERIEELKRWLTDPIWLKTRLQRHGLGALIDDFDYLDERDVVRLVQSALKMDAQTIFLDQNQLSTQLLGRLGRGIAPEIDRLIDAMPPATTGPWLRSVQSVLHPPGGALVRVLRGYAAGHDGTVRSIAMDPQGRWAITAGNSTQDQSVIIWNLRNGSHRKMAGQAPAGGYTPLAITDDGAFALIASGAEIRLVQTIDGNVVVSHTNGEVLITAVALSGDGQIAILGDVEGAVYLWTIADGPPQQLGSHAGVVHAVDISRNSQIAAAAYEDSIKLWDLQSARELSTVEEAAFVPENFARCFRIADDGSVLWAGPSFIEQNQQGLKTYGRAALKKWSLTDPVIRMSEHMQASGYFAVSTNGRRALVKHVRDGSEELGLYDLAGAPSIITLPNIGRGIATAVISDNSRSAATSDYEHDLFVWDLDRAIDPLPQPIRAPWHDMKFTGFSTNGRWAIFATADDLSTVIIDVETGTVIEDDVVPEIWVDKSQLQPATSEAMRYDDAPISKKRKRSSKKHTANDYPVDEFGESRGHTATVFDCRRAPNGIFEVTVSHDGTARVWDLRADRSLASFTSERPLKTCHWSPDSRTLA